MSSRQYPRSEEPRRGSLRSFGLGKGVARPRGEGAFGRDRQNSVTVRKGEGS
jgi:hypothetical protein